ncbi:MAG: DoxX family protein [Xanthobacteraceae bacterium]|nr:DoxX family protein [Xanthobacteraceae bacterium]
MTKTVSIYAAQILLGVIAIAAGYAKLGGSGLMVQQFQALGLGHGFLMVAGTAEILAGLCLLLPRGGILGAVLLACVMVGGLGVTIGHVASAVAQPVPASSFTSTSYPSIAKSGRHDGGMIQIVRQRTEWDI